MTDIQEIRVIDDVHILPYSVVPLPILQSFAELNLV